MNPDAGTAHADVLFLDVGQGDCTVALDTAGNAGLVIDCPAKGVDPVLQISKAYSHGLAISVMLSHWDHDHFGGFLRVASGVGATRLFYNQDTMMSPDDDKTVRRARMLQLLEEPFASMEQLGAKDGTVFHVGSIVVRVLAPSHMHATEAVAKVDRNLSSVVALLAIHGFSVLVGGDADERVWTRLLSEKRLLKADVLRVAHHGGSLGTRTVEVTEQIATAVEPKYSVVSVGTNNTYGHPMPEVIEHLAKRSRLACTEVTSACHSKLGRGTSGVPCGGTIGFRIAHGAAVREIGWDSQQRTVDTWERPMCRFATPATTKPQKIRKVPPPRRPKAS